MTDKKHSFGFTIVELIIVIVVIGILAALVLNTFSGVQGRARDTERKTDVAAIAAQLEIFYSDNGYYPSYTVLNSETWISANLKGLDLDATRTPDKNGQTGTSLASTTNPNITQYGYQAFDSTGSASGLCNNSSGDLSATKACKKFKLYYHLEDEAGTKVKSSLN